MARSAGNKARDDLMTSRNSADGFDGALPAIIASDTGHDVDAGGEAFFDQKASQFLRPRFR